MTTTNQFTNMNHPMNISQMNESIQTSVSCTPVVISQSNPSIQISQVNNNSMQIPRFSNLQDSNANNVNTSVFRNVDQSLMKVTVSNPKLNNW